MQRFRWLALGVITLAGTGCPPLALKCEVDGDCGAEQVCEDGTCREPGSTSSSSGVVPSSSSGTTSSSGATSRAGTSSAGVTSSGASASGGASSGATSGTGSAASSATAATSTAPSSGNRSSGVSASNAGTSAAPPSSSAPSSSGPPCTGECPCNTITGPLCDVGGGRCFTDGSVNPANSCQVCDAAADGFGWTANVGATCDDANGCTLTDLCDANGACGGVAKCDDSNSCTVDTCDTVDFSCTNVQPSTVCTIDGTCYVDTTINPLNPCLRCDTAANTTSWTTRTGQPCSSGAFCMVQEVCDASGACGNGVQRDCQDEHACTADTCNPTTRTCDHTLTGATCLVPGAGCVAQGDPRPGFPCQYCDTALAPDAWTLRNPGTLCNDGFFCSVGDACDSQGGCAGQPNNCEDGLACTSANCNEAEDACVTTINDAYCVIDGSCIPVGAVDPNNACRTCDKDRSQTAYTNLPDNHTCSDNDQCTAGDRCVAQTDCSSGNCLTTVQCLGSPRNCEIDNNPCTAGSCDPSFGCATVELALTGPSCTGFNLCFQTYTCADGQCLGSYPVTCAAQDQCHDPGQCDPATGACSNPPKGNGTPCNDGNLCTQIDSCQGGTCVGSNPRPCAASDQCHDPGTCDPGTGVCSDPAKLNGSTCNDGNLCTQTDTCQDGVCSGGSLRTCTALDQCHDPGTCEPSTGVCSNPAKGNGALCNDGNLCTQTDTCQGGGCTGSNPVTCTPAGQCFDVGVCDPGTGTCNDPPKPNLTPCNDDGNTCTYDRCNGSGTCSHPNKPQFAICDDGDACTSGDMCNGSGACGGSVVTCEDGLACTSDQCTYPNGQCANQLLSGWCRTPDGCFTDGATRPGYPCYYCSSSLNPTGWTQRPAGPADDGLFCTVNDTCDSAGNFTTAARVCNDGLTCTSETCNEATDTCDPTIAAGTCLVGSCYASGAAIGTCTTCNPSASQTSATPVPSGSQTSTCSGLKFHCCGIACRDFSTNTNCGDCGVVCSGGDTCKCDSGTIPCQSWACQP